MLRSPRKLDAPDTPNFGLSAAAPLSPFALTGTSEPWWPGFETSFVI